jgi:hypothetical protein
MRATPQPLGGELGEPPLDEVEPARVGRREVLVAEARELLESFPGTEAKDTWEDLCEAVLEEVEGRSDESLSQETAPLVSGAPPGPLVQMMQRALFLGVLVAPD